MLLNSYRKEIFRPECNPSFQSLHCLAYLEENVGEVLPYLNTVLGGDEFYPEPPALTLRTQGKLITIHPQKIASVSAEELSLIIEGLNEIIGG